MKRLKTELNALVNRSVDRHLRIAVTGLSRSGKTAFITGMVNQLLNIHTGARLPLLSAVRDERLLGVKRILSAISVFPVLPMMKGWLSFTVSLRPGLRQRAASARFVSRCATNRTIRCCVILKRPPRCTWKSSIIPASGCSIYRC